MISLTFSGKKIQEKKRTKQTPAISCLKKGIPTYRNKWKKHVAEKLENAIETLMKHIERGCLSAIPVGSETNRNDRFHRCLSNHGILKQLRLGVALGKAALLSAVQKRNFEIEHGSSCAWL